MSNDEILCIGVNYEIYEGGQPVKWGNSSAQFRPEQAPDLMEAVRDSASKLCGCDPKSVRIVGMWRIL